MGQEAMSGLTTVTVPAGRYARSLRLILRRARRAKVIPAASVLSSPQRPQASLPGTGNNPLETPFSPSQLVNPSYLPTPNPPTGVSPRSLLMMGSNLVEGSPQSATELFEFDLLFAQETLEKAGLQLGEGNQLPL